MKRLKQFAYFEPATVAEAIEILVDKGCDAYPLAGGTDLLVRMKRGDISPSAIVNLKRIDALKEIRNDVGNCVQIGALVSISDIENSPVMQSSYPILTQAAGVLGAQSIRNLATIGGNIGRASPASDVAPSLMVLKARVGVEGSEGGRELEIGDVFAGPGATRLADGEIITSFILPESAPNTGAAYLKLGRRGGGGDCALVGVAVLLTIGLESADIKDARIAMSSVGPNPLRAKKAEEVIMSGNLDEERMREAARVTAAETSPITDMRCSASYRKEMVQVLTFRALQEAMQKAEGGMPK